MRKSASIFITCLLMLALGTSNAFGQAAEDSKTYAMIMGISNYKFIRPLTYADSDAELFKDFLKSGSGGNVPDSNIYFLKNEEAKAANFWVKGMAWLRSKSLKKGDKLYIYLAGHGDAINQDEFFFLTYDCNPAGDKNNYIITGTVQLYNLKSRIGEFSRKGVDVIFIMDACRTNELPGGGEGQQQLQAAISEKRAGEVIMLATGAGQESLEDASIGSGHGLFTYYLVDGLVGLADSTINHDRKVTLGELQKFIGNTVPVMAEQRFRKKQDPFLCCDEDKEKVISIVDTAFLRKWILAKQLRGSLQGYGSEFQSIARNFKTRGVYEVSDTSILDLYNNFNKALKELNLTGAPNSAESYYQQLARLAPSSNYTLDARLSLATEFINFAQSKVNMYLQGRDVASVQRIRSQLDDEENSDEVSSSVDRMEKVARLNFSGVGQMLEKAIAYLSDEDETALRSLNAMNFFFKANGYYEKRSGQNIDLKQAIDFAHAAYKADPKAAYILNTLASLQLDNNNPDSAIFFAKKAIQVAPNWRYPYVNVANAYSKLNRSDSAILYHRKAIDVDPKWADAYVDLGFYYFRMHKLDSAKANYEKALQLDPNNVFANNNMGWLQRELKHYDAAISYFRKSLTIDPEFFNAYNGISRVFTDMGKFDSARAYYHKAMSNYPDKLITSNYLGNFYADINKLDSAQAYFREAAVLDPTYDAPFINLGKIFMTRNNFDSAKYYFNKVIELNVNNFRGYNQMGIMFSEMKEFDSAQYYYRKAIDLSPNSTIVLNNLGLSFFSQKKFDSASVYFRQVINASPNNPQASSNLGLVFFEMKRYDSAKFYYNQALRVKPDLSSALINMGLLLTTTKAYDEAKSLFRSVIENDPRNQIALRNLETVYKELNQYDSAIAIYDWVLNQGVEAPEVFNNLGQLYYEQEKFDLAVSNYKYAFEKDPTYARAMYNIGAVYNRLEQFDSAVVYLKKAFVLDPKYTNAALGLGTTYNQLGQYDSSIVYLSKAVLLNPSFSGAYYYLACSFAQANKHEDALRYLLQALERGYNLYEYIMIEPDLEPIRKYKSFSDMMKKYFPKKYKDPNNNNP